MNLVCRGLSYSFLFAWSIGLTLLDDRSANMQTGVWPILGFSVYSLVAEVFLTSYSSLSAYYITFYKLWRVVFISGLLTMANAITVINGVIDTEDLAKGLWVFKIASIVVIPLMAVVYFYLLFRLLEELCYGPNNSTKVGHASNSHLPLEVMAWFTALVASAFTTFLLLTSGKKSLYERQLTEMSDLIIAGFIVVAVLLLTLA